MYLSGSSLKEIILKNNIIKNYKETQIKNISYDLIIEKIIVSQKIKDTEENRASYTHYEINPGETVFVSTMETISLPNNLFAKIIPRNSCIRQGIDICAPIYQPGHNTRIFIRVTNISEDVINLENNTCIASLMLYQLISDVKDPYNGTFVDEFTYSGLGKFHSSPIPKVSKLEKKIDSIKDLEKGIYSTVITIMTVIISVFSLLNLNVSFLNNCTTIKTLIVYNLITVGSLFALIGLIVGVLAPRNTEQMSNPFNTMVKILIASGILIFVAILLVA